ncbi:MAG: ABC transporter permease [Acidimicrobiales bacterium]
MSAVSAVTSYPAFRVVEREIQVFLRLWRATVFSSFVTPLLFLAAMGLGLGGLVNQHGHVQGLNYLSFVAPGLMAATAMQIGAGESLWPVLGGVKWDRRSHAMVGTPLAPSDVYEGFLLWVALRTTASALAFLVVASALGGVGSPWAVLAVPATVLGALAFAAPLGAFAVSQDSDQAFPVIMRLGVIPLFLFSGTFFPISQLPGWLEPLAQVSPLYHAVELSRSATTGTTHWMADVVHIAVLVGCVAAGTWWGRRAFYRRLSP